MNVAIMGASNKPEKYAHMAFTMLRENGHAVYPVHPALKEIEGVKVYASIKDITDPIDTVTLYIGSDLSTKLTDDILAAHPHRIIFNPGAENPNLQKQARAKRIETLDACTLVLLRTHQF